MSPAFIFAGISVMLLVNAASAPLVGRIIDRFGASRVLASGSVIASIGILILSFAHSPLVFYLAWTVLGVAMATALSTPAFAALVEISGRGARSDISTLTLFTGFSSFLFWPFTLYLLHFFDWRTILWFYAAANLLICLPIHGLMLPRAGSAGHARVGAIDASSRVGLDSSRERAGFWLVVIAFSSAGFVGWGLAQQLPSLFTDLGLAPMTAISIAGFVGPVQVAARAIDMIFSGRTRALTVACGAVALLTVAVAVLATTFMISQSEATRATVGVIVFIALWGTANGLISVARASVPLELFEPARYGTWMGRIALYQNLSFAAAPVVLAAMIHRVSPLAALALSAVCLLVALTAMIALSRLLSDAETAAASDGKP